MLRLLEIVSEFFTETVPMVIVITIAFASTSYVAWKWNLSRQDEERYFWGEWKKLFLSRPDFVKAKQPELYQRFQNG